MIKFIERFFYFDLPVLKEMPAHVRNLHIDTMALALHLAGADKPTDRTVTGYSRATKS